MPFIILLLLPILGKAQDAIKTAPKADTVAIKAARLPYTQFEIYPRFKKNKTIFSYLDTSLTRSKIIKSPVKGYCVSTMLVDSEGYCSGARILETMNPETDSAVLSVLKSIHKLKPANYYSQDVNYNVVLSTKFSTNADGSFKVHTNVYYPAKGSTDSDDKSTRFDDTSSVKHDKKIYTFVEQAASFPGGWNEYYKFLGSQIVYPYDARRNRVEGKVFVNFIVETDGSVDNLHITLSPDDDLSIEALRVIRLSPKFSPAMQNGKPVRCYFSIPINFALNK